MKIVTLLDDCGSEHKGLIAKHGLSFYIELGEKKILFDFGPDETALYNAKRLGVPLEQIDFAVGSHGHYDHAGGFLEFQAYLPRAHFVAGKGYLNEKYAVEGCKATYLGAGFDEPWLSSHNVSYSFCDQEIKLADHLSVVGHFERAYDFETIPERFKVLREGRLQHDDFSDEICLVFELPTGLFVVAGCSHPGILNMLSTVHKRFEKRILGVVGGNHLIEADEARIQKTLEILHGFGIKYLGFNHCSGTLFEKVVASDPEIEAFHLRTGECLLLDHEVDG